MTPARILRGILIGSVCAILGALALEALRDSQIVPVQYVAYAIVVGALPSIVLMVPLIRNRMFAACVSALIFGYVTLRYATDMLDHPVDSWVPDALVAYLDHFLVPLGWLAVVIYAFGQWRRRPTPTDEL